MHGPLAFAPRETTITATPPEFRLLADSSPVPMWLASADRKRRFVNRAYQSFLGCDHEAGLHFDWLRIVHPDDRDHVISVARAIDIAAEPLTLEARFRRHDGAWRWMRSISQPSYDANGQHEGFVGVAFDLTDAKAAELALRAREQRLSAYVNQAAAGFGEVDLTGLFTHVNDRFCEITGYSRSELLARTMQSITHPDDLPRNLPLFEACVAHGTPYQHEKRYVRRDGSIVWVNNSVSIVRDINGRVSGVLAVSIDVTEHRRIAGELQEAEERLRLATQSTGVGTWEWDLQRLRGRLSEEAQQMVGLVKRDEITLEERLANIHPADRDRLTAESRIWAAEKKEFVTEYRIVRPDGAVRWIESRGGMLRGSDGTVSRSVGTMLDITERRQTQERLEELNRLLETEVADRTAERDGMWRLSHDLLLVLDPRLRIVAANPAAAELTGYAPEEMVGRGLKSLIHPEDWRKALTGIRSGRRAAVRNIEARFIARDGSVRDFCWNAAPEGGRAYVSGRDITAEKQRMNELLAAQEALRQSQKLEAMGQLTGGVAHDFNNLLSPIIGSLDLLRHRGVGGEREQKLIAAALQSADRARILVQRLLAFARRQPLTLTAVDLSTLLGNLGDLLHSILGPTIDLRIVLDEALPAVLADENQLEMALLNLAVNARDAMPDGGSLTISAQPSAADRGRATHLPDFVTLSVADTGTGMDEATRARATEPFFSTKGIGKGTGLGLSMVEGLIAQLGGSLHLASRPGQGTTVRLRLQVADAREPAAPATVLASPASAEVRGRILLVDDEALVRTATAEILRDRGFTVVECALASEALDRLAGGETADCVVTDHLMPGMSGLDLARRVAQLQPRPPVLLLSGYAETDGFDPEVPFLAKPFDTTMLVARIAGLIARR